MISKENNLAYLNPELAKEWHPYKNGDIKPSDVTIGTGQKAWWVGKCGHEWEATVKERHRGYGCPICAGKRVIDGLNDFQSQFPELAEEWDYERNDPLKPNQITFKSGKQYWWICSKGHHYEASAYDRTRKRGCPYCANKKVIVGTNDLESQNSFLAKEYSSKNSEKANNVFINSHQKVWWECSKCKNEWKASVNSRNRGNGCPACATRMQSSFPEQAVFYYVKQKCPDAVNRYTASFLGRMELDVYIPSLLIGIEYDGKNWHNSELTKKRELEKYGRCVANDITLIRIREDGDPHNDAADYVIEITDNLNDTIRKLLKWNIVSCDIDVERDRYFILNRYVQEFKNHSFAAKYPNIAKEWDYEKNEGLTPNMFLECSMQSKFWWKCEKGHSWQSTIAHRTSMGSNCPYCSNRKLLKGYNDFLTTNKDERLAGEWDHELNEKDGIFPDSLMEGSKKKVWWRCKNNHAWKTTIYERKRGSACPICSNHTIQVGYNDLLTTNPHLANEWNYEKNAPLMPYMFSQGSDKKVWWRCDKGHEWESLIRSRSKGNGCPYCSNKRVKAGENDIGTTHPHLVEEWNIPKNGFKMPTDYTYGSGQKVWWICKKCNFEWEARISDRTTHESGCPNCARNQR